MPAYNFKPHFKHPILDGSKPGTVRKVRKNPTKPGDPLYLYTGQRTENCELIKRETCKAAYQIKIKQTKKAKTIELNGVKLVPIVQHWFATTDGFTNADHFFRFFSMHYGKTFKGVWIVWDQATKDMVTEYLLTQY